MKYVLTVIANVFLFLNITAQTVNSNKSIVWNPYCGDSRLSFTFYSKSLMSGILEPTELIIYNRSSHKLLIRVSYTITDVCGGSKEFSKTEELNGGAESPSSGAFFSGVDFETSCKEARTMGENLKTKISGVNVSIKSVEDITAKEEEEKRKQQEEEELKQRKKEEELKKKKEAEEKRIAEEKKRIKEEEDKRMAAEEAKTKQEAEEKTKKEFEEKETAAKSIADENERKEAVEKIAQEKKVAEKKVIEKKTADEKAAAESKSPKLTDKEKYEIAQMIAKQNEDARRAKALETEGDNLNKLGAVFMDAALEKYKQAQAISYSYTVQQKIEKIEATKALAKAVNDGLDKLEDGADQIRSSLDESGIPRSRGTRFSYEGFTPGFKGFGTVKIVTPMAASITYGFYRIFALEAGFTYLTSPVYKFGLQDNNNYYVGKDIEGSYTAFGPEVSAGIGYPGKHFDLYALYGFYFPFTLTGTPYTQGYTYESFKDNYGITPVITKIKFGTHIKIPKSRLGIGVQYILNGVNREKLLVGGSGDVTDKSNGVKYNLGPGKNSSVDKLKYNSLGISLYLRSR